MLTGTETLTVSRIRSKTYEIADIAEAEYKKPGFQVLPLALPITHCPNLRHRQYRIKNVRGGMYVHDGWG